jgi:hypothetical protein
MGLFDNLKKKAEKLLKDNIGEETLNNLKAQAESVKNDVTETGKAAADWTGKKLEQAAMGALKAAGKVEDFLDGKLGDKQPREERNHFDSPAFTKVEAIIVPAKAPKKKPEKNKTSNALNKAAKKETPATKKTATPAAKTKKPAEKKTKR